MDRFEKVFGSTKVNWRLKSFPMSVFPLYLVTRCLVSDLVPS
jgi:hypothetical protein